MEQDGTKISGDIVPAMARLRTALPAIGKNHRNTNQGWSFRGIDDVLNVIGGALDEAGVVLKCDYDIHSIEPNDKSGFSAFVLLKASFISTTDGSVVSMVYPGQGSDAGDKAVNKAMSAAFKYLIFQGLQVPVQPGVLDDPDRESIPVTAARPARRRLPPNNQ